MSNWAVFVEAGETGAVPAHYVYQGRMQSLSSTSSSWGALAFDARYTVVLRRDGDPHAST